MRNDTHHTIVILIILLLFVNGCKSDSTFSPEEKLKKQAIEIKKLDHLSNQIYKEVKKYDIILIGEQHGTNEPSEFTYGLCKLLTERNEKVILAMEIIPGKMTSFHPNMTRKELKQLDFFQEENNFGINGNAWLNLIERSNKNEDITTKFIDKRHLNNRDLSMYDEIKSLKKQFPHYKIVCLTGNVHNWLIPYNGQNKLGAFIINDTINFARKKVMSINHIFNQGTIMNNIGNGLELREQQGKVNIYNQNLKFDQFLSANIYDYIPQYTHFLYTEKVTHSKPVDLTFK